MVTEEGRTLDRGLVIGQTLSRGQTHKLRLTPRCANDGSINDVSGDLAAEFNP